MQSNGALKTDVKAVILAAGKGTRLYPVTKAIPKPLLPIANKITLEYAFDQLKTLGITDICLVVGESEDLMHESLGDGSEFGVCLTYVRQTEQLGLAHALGFAKDFLGDAAFVLYLGDAVYTGDFKEAFDLFLSEKADNLNIVKWVKDPSRFGVAELDGHRIMTLEEKPQNPKSNYAMAGLYFFGPHKIWDVLKVLQPSARGEYEITDAIQMLIHEGGKVLASEHKGAWFDTGTLDSFLETNHFIAGKEKHVPQDCKIEASIGRDVVIGEGVELKCAHIEESVILPGAKINVQGNIVRCILGGTIESIEDLSEAILFDDLSV